VDRGVKAHIAEVRPPVRDRRLLEIENPFARREKSRRPRLVSARPITREKLKEELRGDYIPWSGSTLVMDVDSPVLRGGENDPIELKDTTNGEWKRNVQAIKSARLLDHPVTVDRDVLRLKKRTLGKRVRIRKGVKADRFSLGRKLLRHGSEPKALRRNQTATTNLPR